MATLYARATVAHVVAACVLAFAARRIAPRGLARRSISALLLAGAAVLVSGAWLTHASSRIDTVGALMTVTLLHQLGAAAWVGGIAHLVLLRRSLKASDAAAELWPRLL